MQVDFANIITSCEHSNIINLCEHFCDARLGSIQRARKKKKRNAIENFSFSVQYYNV